MKRRRKKEEKDKLKKQQKDERRQQYIKEKAQKDKEEAEKAILGQKNPFSVFKKEVMRKMTWTMILWFSQTLPPVITSLKAHFHDYQQLKQWKVSI